MNEKELDTIRGFHLELYKDEKGRLYTSRFAMAFGGLRHDMIKNVQTIAYQLQILLAKQYKLDPSDFVIMSSEEPDGRLDVWLRQRQRTTTQVNIGHKKFIRIED